MSAKLLVESLVAQMVGQARIKRQTLAAMLASAPGCIYCAGANIATTIEHMPPRIVFVGRHRPKGLEFPACKACNYNTRHTDLIAAMLARSWSDVETDAARDDVVRIYRAVSNNVPAILHEMYMGRAAEKLVRKRRNIPPDGHPLRADGPLLNHHVLTFAAKLGFALHHEVTGSCVPTGGGVQVMWFSNVQALNGEIPDSLFTMLPTRLTLRQGIKSVADQFEYATSAVEQDHMLYYAVFNHSFAVAGVVARDRTIYLNAHPDVRIFAPGDFLTTHDVQ